MTSKLISLFLSFDFFDMFIVIHYKMGLGGRFQEGIHQGIYSYKKESV